MNRFAIEDKEAHRGSIGFSLCAFPLTQAKAYATFSEALPISDLR
jgi:hypothetical protein